MELFGNLIDNAYKWCQSRVGIQGRIQVADNGIDYLHVHIEDDGQGIPPWAIEQVMQRGRRADTVVEGQGIGLAIVSDIVNAYQGEMKIESTASGGTKVDIFLKM